VAEKLHMQTVRDNFSQGCDS